MKFTTAPRLALCLLLSPAAVSGANSIEVSIDTTKTGAPINPYIYGQFIEHLGRCIYGGIWSQMLEDRKFYFPITAEYDPYRALEDSDFPVVGASPWEIVGEPDSVTMVTEPDDVFVGEHSPRVNAGSGLRQHDLGIVDGKDYEGYVWAKPLDGSAEIEVSLIWGEGANDRSSATLRFRNGDYSKQTFTIPAGRTLERGAILELRVSGSDVLLGPPSLMPADNVNGMRPDTLALLKDLNGTIYRWPGGNFVSGYDWRDGIGDRDRRPPRSNPAWTGVEHNDFGTDEFIAFCREIDTVPLIAANAGFGDDYSAAQWVEYCNGDASTIGGRWRVENGHKEPFNVKYWCIGNEMWGTFQLGFMQLHQYVLKHNRFADAMWEVDPDLVLVGVGELEVVNRDHDPQQVASGKSWSQTMLEECGDHMSLMSEHFYSGRRPWTDDQRVDTLTHAGLVREAIRGKAEGHRALQPTLPELDGRIVPISMDEWNYWHREYAYGELGCIYELVDGLGIAAGLHEYYRNSDIIHMAFYAQTVNVIGAIKTTKIAAEMESTALVLQLYREHWGQTPLEIAGDHLPYDLAAAMTVDGRTLTLSVVNPTEDVVELDFDLEGATATGTIIRRHITGPDARSHNMPGEPRVIDIHEQPGFDTDAPLSVPALSCALFTVPLE